MGKIPFAFSSFTALLYEPAYYQFWFMYSLFAIYLLLPVLQAVVLKLERRHLEYILILWLVFSLVLIA
jgi:surface polysaccharide O-acyltransferase-like enzyme